MYAVQRKKANKAVTLWAAFLSVAVSVLITCVSLTGEDPITRMRLSTTRVMAFKGDKPGGSGTGVYLRGRNGGLYVLTAAHVIPDSCDQRAMLEPHLLGPRVLLPLVETELILLDRSRDVALLRVNAEQEFMLLEYRTARLSRRPLSPGDPVRHCGFFHGLKIARGVVQGHVIATNSFSFIDPVAILLDAVDMLAYRGCSGGGLFDANGEVVGTMTGSTESGLALTVPLWRIREALRISGLPVEFD